MRRKGKRKVRRLHRSWFGRIKLYLFFALAYWLFKNESVRAFFDSGYLTAALVGFIVFWFAAAVVGTVIGWNRRKREDKTQDGEDGLFL